MRYIVSLVSMIWSAIVGETPRKVDWDNDQTPPRNVTLTSGGKYPWIRGQC